MKENETTVLKPGYVSWRTFINFLDILKADGVPTHIDAGVLSNMSGTVRSQLRLTLRFLNLIDKEFQTSETLNRLAMAEQEDRKQILDVVLRESYGFLFNPDDDFDLIKSTANKFSEKFGQYGITGQTKIRAEAFFLSAAKFSDIEISRYITENRRTRKTRPTKTKKPTPKPGIKQPDEVSTGKAEDESKRPGFEKIRGTLLNGKYGLLHKLQIEKLPENGKWTVSQKQQYLAAYQSLLNLLVTEVKEDDGYDLE